jgi:hypothetical protein
VRAKLVRLRRSTRWHAARGVRIGRKVAWRVLDFASPRAYRLWRDERIRHEIAAGRRNGVWRESPTSASWLAVQPREFRATAPLPVGPIREPVPGAPYQPGDVVVVVAAIDRNVRDVSEHIGKVGRVVHLEYGCGCGQTFPGDPMIGVELGDLVEEFWREELDRAPGSPS